MVATSRVEAFSLRHAQILDGATSFVSALQNSVAIGLDIYGVNDASLATDVGNFENNGDDATLSRWNWINFANLTVQGGYLSFPLLSQLSGTPLITTAVSAASEVQGITSNGASAGSYTLSFGGQTTGNIAYNAAASAVQTALQALSTIGTGNATVSGGPSNTTALAVTFAGTLANKPQQLITIDLTGLTGATGGVVSRTTAGTPADTRYQIDLWHEDSINAAPKPALLTMPARDENGLSRLLVIGLFKCQFGPIGFDGPSYKNGLKVNYAATALPSNLDEVGVAFADTKKRIGRAIALLDV